ncbi:MAG: SIMPL domain-containing protein [Candidatus Pacebacteria bacterium]|nr:SIMPL domain-containing protein [Candidatus Paceibacterota bacterium]
MCNIECFKKSFWFWISVFLAVCAIWTAYAIKPLIQYGNSLAPARTITVSGEGKAVAIPDIAQVSFSVLTRGSSPEKISDENIKKMNAAIDYVKGEGIDVKDIKTTGYNLSPNYEYDKDRRTSYISGYTITQTVQIKIRDFSKIGKILGRLPELGINDIGTLSFDVDEQDEYLNQARKQAFEKAMAKAKEMAKQNGVKIKKVVTFSESQNGYYPYPVYKTALGMGEAAMDAAPRIEAGSQEITVNVSVVYEIK